MFAVLLKLSNFFLKTSGPRPRTFCQKILKKPPKNFYEKIYPPPPPGEIKRYWGYSQKQIKGKVLDHISGFVSWLGFFFSKNPIFQEVGQISYKKKFFLHVFFSFFFLQFFCQISLSHSKNYALPFWGTQSNFSSA